LRGVAPFIWKGSSYFFVSSIKGFLMIELEQLYESASKHLKNKTNPDWEEFICDFEDLYKSKMALYRPDPNKNELNMLSKDELFGTSNPELLDKYFNEKWYEKEEILEDPKNPLEPIRRTDTTNDDDYKKLNLAMNFYMPNGVFYTMILYAFLPDNSLLILFVWRNEHESDFSDSEKLRITLFMRYLASLINVDAKDTIANCPQSEILDFGKKYSLTESEIGVLRDLIVGKSLKQIAKDSDRSYGTVRWHVRNLLEKCEVKSQRNLLSEFYALIKR